MTKYNFIENGTEQQIDAERWAWGVLYHPTPEDAAEAARLTDEKVARLRPEYEARVKTLVDSGAQEKDISTLRDEYETLMLPIPPRRASLLQFSPDGKFHQFAEIDQPNVDRFFLYKLDDPSQRMDIAVRSNMQIFHFYRNIGVRIGGASARRHRVYCFGWKDRETGAESFHFVLPDDRVVMSNDKSVDLTAFSL